MNCSENFYDSQVVDVELEVSLGCLMRWFGNISYQNVCLVLLKIQV